jgi:hypothetical protein
MDRGRFDRLAAALGAVSGRRGVTAGLFAGMVASLSQDLEGSAGKRKRCTHCPQRACCACTNDNFQTTNKCILLETPNAEITLTVAIDLCDAFCDGPNEQVFTVNDNIAGSANVCRADNSCGVKTCPIRV